MKFIIFLFLLHSPLFAQTISTYVGNGTGGCSGYGGLAVSAKINDPLGCAFDSHGNFFFANQFCDLICKVDNSGIFTKIAGGGTSLGDGGLATAAKLSHPNDVVFDTFGNIYIADAAQYRIRKVDISTGIITTIAGTGTAGFSGDGGSATAAMIRGVNGLCIDKNQNLYISDANNNRIRKIDRSGIISTISGTGTGGFSGDGGQATLAKIYLPMDIGIDLIGNLYIADGQNKRIRKVDTFGIISTIAGTGVATYSGDGIPATAANLGAYKIAIDTLGNIFAADSNQRIRMIDVSGIIHTITGTGAGGYSGDGGRADSAQINAPSGISIDNCGNIYFGDVLNNRIRKITAVHTPATLSIASNTGDTICTGTPVTYTATTTATGALTYQWQVNGANVGSGTASYTYSPANGDNVKCVLVNTMPCYTDTASSNTLHVVTTTLGITLSGPVAAPTGSPVTVNATVTGADSAYSIQWRNKGVLFATTTVPTVSYTKAVAVDSIMAKIVSASQSCNDTAVSGVWVVVDSITASPPAPLHKWRGVTCFPNPVRDELIIEADASMGVVVITDVLGRVVVRQLVQANKVSVVTKEWVNGMYFVRMDGVSAGRFLKQ